jgi:hypothetical protein
MAMNSISLHYHLHHSLSRFYKEQAPPLPPSILDGDIPSNAFLRAASKAQINVLPPSSSVTASRTNPKTRAPDQESTRGTQSPINKRTDGRLLSNPGANNKGSSSNTRSNGGNNETTRGKAKQTATAKGESGYDFEPYIWGLY